ncbi:hypothetical protein PUN28_009782 [Cardiocondyla obscurior]|uniref:Uncharacterized protein n=1 Tax=Cardiocondyla obscurior TaxID=286306 RepID=A0AAW2FKC6_9HYME
MRKQVQSLAELRRKESKPHHCKARVLQKDILNISSHVFGEHKRCKALKPEYIIKAKKEAATKDSQKSTQQCAR